MQEWGINKISVMYSLCNAPIYQVFHNKTSSKCTADEIHFETEKPGIVQDIKISDK